MPISGIVQMTHEYNNYRKSQKSASIVAPEPKSHDVQVKDESKLATNSKRDSVREVLAIMMPF